MFLLLTPKSIHSKQDAEKNFLKFKKINYFKAQIINQHL